MVPSMKRSSLPKISPLMVIPWLTQAGAFGETGGTLAASARVEEGAPYPGLSVADCGLLSSGFFHIRHLHGAGSAAAELGPVGQAGGSVRNHDDSTAPQGCKAKRMALAISCAPLRGKKGQVKAGQRLHGSSYAGVSLIVKRGFHLEVCRATRLFLPRESWLSVVQDDTQEGIAFQARAESEAPPWN